MGFAMIATSRCFATADDMSSMMQQIRRADTLSNGMQPNE
jgi:hypothetical protein